MISMTLRSRDLHVSNPLHKGPASGGLLRNLLAGRWGTPALVALILLAAYVLPRLIVYSGVTMTNQQRFLDMPVHLTNMTLMERFAGVDVEADPYLSRFPELLNLDFSTRWPTGVYEVAAPLARIFGPLSIWTVQGVNLLFTVVLVIAVVCLGRMMGDTRLGLWGALLVVLCPALAAHTWYFSLDYPLIAMVTMGLFLLWRTRRFSRLPDSISLGAWSALGLWIKYNYAMYLIVPSLVALALGLRRGPRSGRILLHVTVAVVVALALTCLLARPDVSAMWRELSVHARGTTVEGFTGKLLEPWTVAWLLSVLWLAAASFPLPLLVLALPGVVLAHRARFRRQLALLLAFLWGNGVVLTLMANKMERYVQPLYPVFCLLTVWGCFRLMPRRLRTAGLVVTVAAHGAVLVWTASSPLPWIPDMVTSEDTWYMWEIHTPGRYMLGELRQKTFHPHCDLRPVARQVASLVGQSSASRPLGVGALWRQVPARDTLEPNELSYFTYLAAAQADRARLLIPLVSLEHHLPEQVLQMPQLLLAHHPKVDLAGEYPMLRIVGRRSLELECGDTREEIWLTLARGTAPMNR